MFARAVCGACPASMLQRCVAARIQNLPQCPCLHPAVLSPPYRTLCPLPMVPRPPCTTTDAVNELCSKNKYTCWFGGKKDWETQCPLISAEGTLLKQGCGQVRSAGCCPLVPGFAANTAPFANVPYGPYSFLSIAHSRLGLPILAFSLCLHFVPVMPSLLCQASVAQ